MTDEKRRFSRLAFDAKAQLTIGESVYEVSKIVNLSVGGCLLEMKGTFVVGRECTFTLFLPHMAPGVDVQGEIVRAGNGEVSLKFTGIRPEDLFHLQNIIRYNADDPDIIEKEIDAHPGLK